MRRCEILALRWKNVDLEKGVIYVEENLVRSKNKGLLVKELKTANSLREIFISESVVSPLRKHKLLQNQEGSKITNYKDRDLVVCAKNGNYLEPRNLIRKFKELIQKQMYLHFHSITYATLMRQF